jgi:hypothetical protein
MYVVIPKFPHTASKWCSLQLRYNFTLNISSISLLWFRCLWQVKMKSEIYNILCGNHNEKRAICKMKMTVRNRGIHSSGILCSVDWQLVTEVSGQTFGPSFKSHTTWPLNMGQIGCPETSVTTYLSQLRNIPEEQRSHLHRGGNLKSRKVKNRQH